MTPSPRDHDAIESISEALVYWASEAPEASALLAPGREPITYHALQGVVNRLASDLRALGLGRQDGIALLFPEGPELCLALLAAIEVGVAVPLAWPSPMTEHERILANPRVRALLVSTAISSSALATVDRTLPVVRFLAGPSGRLEDVQIDGPVQDGTAPATPAGPVKIALILHSSGATGHPKLVPRLHRAIVSTCREVAAARAMTAADRGLSLSKTVYAQGTSDLLVSLFIGASTLSVPGLDFAAMPLWWREYQPTWLSTTPAVLRIIAEERGELRDVLRQFPPRFIVSGAGPLSAGEAREFEAALGVPILDGYGLSEAPVIAGGALREGGRPPGAIGLPRCDVRIVGEPGEPLPTGTTGEIVVRGPRVFPGYLDDAEANAAAFLPGGWFRTGDLGFLDDAGYLHLTGRRGEIINRGGEKIAPHEVDDALERHAAVAEAAVFAVPDARLGEDIVAAVVLKRDTTCSARELRCWMLDRLSPYKVPRRIWFVDDLPRTATGKVQRHELARRWREERA